MKKGPLQEIDSKNQMAVDERETVGHWKSYQVYILKKSEYIDNQHNLKDDVVYVIADDG